MILQRRTRMQIGLKILSPAFLFLLLNCWPFEPRQAENPQSLSDAKAALAPSEVPQILEDIYNDRLSILHLNRLLNEQFAFYTDPSLGLGSQTWGRDEEVRIAGNTINSYTNLLLHLSTSSDHPDPLITYEEKVWLTRLYRLVGMTQTDTVTAAGKAEFLVQISSNAEWTLLQWNDFKTDTLKSWGQLKLEKR